MTRRSRLAALFALALTAPLLTTPVGAVPAEAAPADKTAKSTWIVRYKNGYSAQGASAKAERAGLSVQTRLEKVFPGAVMELTETQLSQVRADSSVAAVYENKRYVSFGAQSNPGWALDRIDQKWGKAGWFTSYYQGTNVPVYVVDSGVDSSLKEFGGRVSAGYSAVGGSATTDGLYHGTHVAGLVGSTTFGSAKRARIIPVKVLDDYGYGTSAGVLAGLEWVLKNHVDGTAAVTNMSLGTNVADGIDPAVDDAVGRMIAEGITVVAAAGNENADACKISPAHLPAVITVGAIGDSTTSVNKRWVDTASEGSNWGTCLDLFAPGRNVPSTVPASTGHRYALMTGTSMASPVTAGVVAQILQARPSWTPAQVSAQLMAQTWKSTATDPRVSNRGTGSPNVVLSSMSTVTPGVLERAGTPGVTGTPRVGRVLTGSTGTWGVGPVVVTRQWERVNIWGTATPIKGATGSTYTLTRTDKYFRIRLRVTASKPLYRTTSVVSAQTAQVR